MFFSPNVIATGTTMSKGKVLNLKDKINGNEMDLSLCNLSEVPVKELVSCLLEFVLYLLISAM